MQIKSLKCTHNSKIANELKHIIQHRQGKHKRDVGSSLPQVLCKGAHVLFTIVVFVCA